MLFSLSIEIDRKSIEIDWYSLNSNFDSIKVIRVLNMVHFERKRNTYYIYSYSCNQVFTFMKSVANLALRSKWAILNILITMKFRCRRSKLLDSYTMEPQNPTFCIIHQCLICKTLRMSVSICPTWSGQMFNLHRLNRQLPQPWRLMQQ